jgi:putative transposase
MPEHVHLLLGEPEHVAFTSAIQVLKQETSRKLKVIEKKFWQTRYYDVHVRTDKKKIEKLKYIHRNPVQRGLVVEPQLWLWSSYRHYVTGERGEVEVSSHWTETTG